MSEREDRKIVNIFEDEFLPYDLEGPLQEDMGYIPLSYNKDGDANGAYVIKMEPGAATIAHEHSGNEDYLIIEGDLTARYFYLHAEGADAESKWRGPVFMCTSNKEFKIRGVKDCFARGYERTGFFEVDTAEQKSWQVRLTRANQTKKDDTSQ